MASSVGTWLLMLAVGQLPPTPAPTQAEVAAAVSRMGDERFIAREQATEQLWQWGDVSERALQEALKNPDAEIRIRAKTVLDRFNLGLYPDISPESAAAIRQYRGGQQSQKLAAVQRLQSLQDWRTLNRLQRNETDATVRSQIGVALRGDLLKRVAASIESGELTTAAEMLRNDAVIGDPMVQRQLVTIYALRKELSARTDELKSELTSTPNEPKERLLAMLYEANGDTASADPIFARRYTVNPLAAVEVASWRGDWKQAAKHSDAYIAANPDQKNFDLKAFNAIFHRLAGDDAKADAVLDTIRKETPSQQTWQVMELLLLHERGTDAISELKTIRPTMAFELHAMRHEFDQALALANVRVGRSYDDEWFASLPVGDLPDSSEGPATPDEQHTNRRHSLALRAAYFLRQLGETKDALAIFAYLRKLDLPGSINSQRYRRAELCRIETRLGLDDLALADAASFIASGNDPSFIATFFARQGAVALQWHEVLMAEAADEPIADRLAKIHLLIRPSTAQKKSDVWRQAIEAALATLPEEKGAARYQRVEAVAEAYLAHGARQEAIALLSRDNLSSLLYLRGGDLLREDKQYAAAKAIYAKVAASEPHRAVALYLQGVCETEQGDAAAGQKLKDQALLLAVDNSARILLFNGLASRRLTRDAIATRDLWKQTSPELNAALSKEYGDVLAEDGPGAAAKEWDVTLVRLSGISATLTEDAGYLTLTHARRRARAKAAIAVGDKETFQRELAACLRVLPLGWEMIDDIVPKLDAAGWKTEADALFDEQLAKVTALAKKYPHSARFSNAVAWISATCRRNLDAALVQANRTMELSPNNASYLDTLAEVHFARGNIAEAIATQRRVVELSPLPLFQERLEKFEAAGKGTP